MTRLIVIDDASDAPQDTTLVDMVREHWDGDLILDRNEQNRGFLPTANHGMRLGDASTIVLLNSDVLVAPGWLEGLHECLWSRPDIGVVTALSNYSSVTSLRSYYGAGHLTISRAVRQVSERARPDIMMAVGFCVAIRRSLAEALDYFDDAFGRGYFEEADLSLRAARMGFMTVADDATYLHHHGWGSFGGSIRDDLMKANETVFEGRWGQGAHGQLRRAVHVSEPFRALEQNVADALASVAQVAPRRGLPTKATRLVARAASVAGERNEPVQQRPTSARYGYERWAEIAVEGCRGPAAGRAADVLVLTDDLSVHPGSTALLQIVDLLAEADLSISFATTGAFDPGLFAEPCRVRPFVLSGPEELLDAVPAHRLVIATSPSTVYDALLIRERDGARVVSWFAGQAAPRALGWPEDDLALAWAPRFASAHLGEYSAEQGPTPFLRVPFGVCRDTFQPNATAGSDAEVLLPFDARGSVRSSDIVRRTVVSLHQRGHRVRLYGDELPGLEVPSTRFLVQEDEAQLLRRAALVVETVPIMGQERLRLRCAAVATPMIAAAPLSPSCPLDRDALHLSPRADAERAVELADELLSGQRDDVVAQRLAYGLDRAAGRCIRTEAEALERACIQLMVDAR